MNSKKQNSKKLTEAPKELSRTEAPNNFLRELSEEELWGVVGGILVGGVVVGTFGTLKNYVGVDATLRSKIVGVGTLVEGDFDSFNLT